MFASILILFTIPAIIIRASSGISAVAAAMSTQHRVGT
jgi:hypothetical protein